MPYTYLIHTAHIPQNGQHVMGIVLSHICWGTPGPPTPEPSPTGSVGGWARHKSLLTWRGVQKVRSNAPCPQNLHFSHDKKGDMSAERVCP